MRKGLIYGFIIAFLVIAILVEGAMMLLEKKPWEKKAQEDEKNVEVTSIPQNNTATSVPTAIETMIIPSQDENTVEDRQEERVVELPGEVKVTKKYYNPKADELVYTYMETNKINGYGKYSVPQINLKGIGVDAVNEEIRTTFDRILDSYNDSNIEIDYNYFLYQSASYKYYKNGDVLSLIIECNTEDGGNRNYFIYNIDLTTNNKLSSTDLINKLNISESEFRNKLINSVITLDLYNHTKYPQISSEIQSKQCNLTVEMYKNKKADDIKLFINKSGQLCAELVVYNTVGAEFATWISNLITGSSASSMSDI